MTPFVLATMVGGYMLLAPPPRPKFHQPTYSRVYIMKKPRKAKSKRPKTMVEEVK